MCGLALAFTLSSRSVSLSLSLSLSDTYKAKLEKILNNVILVSEVAELAAAADTLPDPDGNVSDSTPPANRRRGAGHVRWSSLKFEDRKKLRNAPQTVAQETFSDDSDGSDSESDSDSEDSDGSKIKGDDKNDKSKSKPGSMLDRRAETQFHKSFSSLSLDTSTKHFKIKNQLGRWDDPLNKMDKVGNQRFAIYSRVEYASQFLLRLLAIELVGFRHFEVPPCTDIYGLATPILGIIWTSIE